MGVKGSTLRRPAARRPRGYIPVAVGVDEDTRRFMVHTKALSNEEFLQFLRSSAEEYGFCNQGVLRIPYDAKAFEGWLTTTAKRRHFSTQPKIS